MSIKDRLEKAVEDFNKVNEQINELVAVREQLRGRVMALQELAQEEETVEPESE